MSEAIDNSLSDLGLFVKETLYDRLKNKYNISPEDIGKRVTDFSNEIEGIFGLGAKRLENLIIKKLNERTGLNRVLGHGFLKFHSLNIFKWLEKNTSKTEKID